MDLTAPDPSTSTQPDELEQEPSTLDPYLAALSDMAFRPMLSASANQTETYVAMLFLPILSEFRANWGDSQQNPSKVHSHGCPTKLIFR